MTKPLRPDQIKQYPILSAIAVVAREDTFILVRRGNEPNAGLWGFPGGKVELGETVFDCAKRELLEETGVSAQPREILTYMDIIHHGADGQVEYHYLLVAVLCEFLSGEPLAADDAAAAEWVSFEDIKMHRIEMTRNVDRVAELARYHELHRGFIQ